MIKKDEKEMLKKRIDDAVAVLEKIEDLATKNPTLAKVLREAKNRGKAKGYYEVMYTVYDKSYEVLV
jgi:hypothetical protein